MPCILSNKTTCDAAHIRFGFYAIGMKPGDDLVLPLSPELHRTQHAIGEVLFWRGHITSEVLMNALKALARERYAEWKKANDK